MEAKLLFSQDEAAELLHMAPRTLASMRGVGLGPTFFRVNRRVAYRITDLNEYIADNMHKPTIGDDINDGDDQTAYDYTPVKS